MDNFDSYLRNIDINVIKSRIENEWDIIQDIPYQVSMREFEKKKQQSQKFVDLIIFYMDIELQIIQFGFMEIQGQTIDGQELLSSFIDIMKLYLIGNGELSLPENPDSLVNFFLSYVVRRLNQ